MKKSKKIAIEIVGTITKTKKRLIFSFIII